jgi:type I restriction enzyme S subunit
MKNSWQTKTLAETCEVFADGDWIESKDQSAAGIRLIQTGNVGEGVFKDRGDKARYISEATFKRLRCTEIFEGDCLVSRLPDPVGRSCLLPETGERMITAVDCTIIRFNQKEVIPEFFNYYSQSDDYLDSVDSETTGTTRKRISRSKLGLTPILVPPLSEQRRIVGILDDAFEGLANAKANAEQNLQNARALFESHLQAVFTQRGDDYVERRLGDCVQDISTGPFGSLLHKSDYEHGEIPLVNPINIEGDEIIPDARKAVGKATAQRLARYALRENDIVIGRRGEIGRCAVVSRDQAGWLCGTGCFVIRPSDKTDPHFLTHLLRSRPYRGQLESVAGRATMPSISNNDLANLVIVLPPVAHQRKTLSLLESLSEETQRLESLYQRKLAALDELKKSLLHRAFSGEL